MCCYDQFLMQSEAVVNAGPAVFISPSGPNPIMVQAMFSPYLLVYFLKKNLFTVENSSISAD
jgi:hypothetical protein